MKLFDGYELRADRLTIHYGERDGVFQIRWSGYLRLGDSAEAFDTVVATAVQSGAPVVMDLAQLRAVDSRGIGALVSAATKLQGRLAVLNLTRRISEILALCRLLTALPIADVAAA